jgi:hypothetical protein
VEILAAAEAALRVPAAIDLPQRTRSRLDRRRR